MDHLFIFRVALHKVEREFIRGDFSIRTSAHEFIYQSLHTPNHLQIHQIICPRCNSYKNHQTLRYELTDLN